MVKKDGIFVSPLTLLYALRYALKRIGPSHTIVRDDIFNNIENFEKKDLEQFIIEIEKEIQSSAFPDENNKNYWNKFLVDLKDEIEKRVSIEEAYKKES